MSIIVEHVVLCIILHIQIEMRNCRHLFPTSLVDCVHDSCGAFEWFTMQGALLAYVEYPQLQRNFSNYEHFNSSNGCRVVDYSVADVGFIGEKGKWKLNCCSLTIAITCSTC